MNAGALLELAGVEAGYSGHEVLRGVSLTLAEGSLTTLIGPNGHGKSTLLRSISGLVRLTKGSIRFAGQRINDLRADEIVGRGIIHIPQGDMLFPQMTVLDNLLMGAYLPLARTRMHENLATVYELLPRLSERKQQLASTLSGGERRMLAIARGLMAAGRLLLVDEPSLGLAPVVRDEIYKVIRALRNKGWTILLVEESAEQIAEISERIYLLDNGAIVWDGDGTELLAKTDLLATYLGT